MQDLSDFFDGIQLNRDASNQLPAQIKSLYSQQAMVQLSALEGLITFVAGSLKNKENLQNQACFTALLDLLQASHYQTTDANKIAVLAQCCRLITLLLDANRLPAQIDVLLCELAALFRNCTDAQVLYHLCGSLDVLSRAGYHYASTIISSGILPRLTELLRVDSRPHQLLALKILRSLVRVDVTQVQQVVDTDQLLDSLAIALASTRESAGGVEVLNIACQVLAALTLGRQKYTSALLQRNIYVRVLELCTYPEVFSEALNVLVNGAKCAGVEEATTMVAKGLIVLLFQLITKIHQYHEEVLKIVLVLDSLLQALDGPHGNPLALYIAQGGGKTALQALLNSNNQLVYELLDTMVTRYFADSR